MKKKDLEELKKQNIGQLEMRIAGLKKEMANFKIDLSMGKVKNVHSILQNKKAVAKIMTILTLKAIAAKSEQDVKANKEVKVGAR